MIISQVTCQCCINFSHPSRNKGKTKSIYHNVMVALIPQESVSSQLDQRVTEQRAASQLHRPVHVGGHPGLCSRARIRFLADIHKWHQPLRQWLDDLLRPVTTLDEQDPQ
nr:hypothetical protein [uncultured bacterium]